MIGRKFKSGLKALLGTFAVCAVLCFVSCDDEDSDEEIAIGVAFPLTGESETIGRSMKNGVELAVEEINASELLGGADLRLIFEDTLGTPDGAESAFRKLISEDAVSAIIGPWSSTSAKKAAPVANENKVVAISPTSSASPDGITAPGDFIFRTSLTVDKLAPEAVRKTKEAFGYSKVATIVNTADTFSVSDNGEVLGELAKYPDLELVEEQSFVRAKNDPLPDLTEQLRAISGSGAEVVFISALSPGRVGIIASAREMGITIPLVATGLTVTNVSDAEKMLERSTEGAVSVGGWAQDGTPQSMDFTEKYRVKYQEEADAFSSRSYSCTRILAAAISRAPTSGPEDIRAALQMIGPESPLEDTIFGEFHFDENGDGVYSPVVRVIRNGRFETLR